MNKESQQVAHKFLELVELDFVVAILIYNGHVVIQLLLS